MNKIAVYMYLTLAVISIILGDLPSTLGSLILAKLHTDSAGDNE